MAPTHHNYASSFLYFLCAVVESCAPNFRCVSSYIIEYERISASIVGLNICRICSLHFLATCTQQYTSHIRTWTSVITASGSYELTLIQCDFCVGWTQTINQLYIFYKKELEICQVFWKEFWTEKNKVSPGLVKFGAILYAPIFTHPVKLMFYIRIVCNMNENECLWTHSKKSCFDVIIRINIVDACCTISSINTNKK